MKLTIVWFATIGRYYVYVEGAAVTAKIGVVIEHGWIERDGAIVDPRAELFSAYFPGLRLSVADAYRAASIKGYLPISWDWGGSPFVRGPQFEQAPEFEAARRAAYQAVLGVAVKVGTRRRGGADGGNTDSESRPVGVAGARGVSRPPTGRILRLEGRGAR